MGMPHTALARAGRPEPRPRNRSSTTASDSLGAILVRSPRIGTNGDVGPGNRRLQTAVARNHLTTSCRPSSCLDLARPSLRCRRCRALTCHDRRAANFSAVINGINLHVLLLAGVLLPLTIGPVWLRVLGHFDPLYYLSTAARDVAADHLATAATWHAFAVLVHLSALTLGWATRTYRQAVA